MAAIRERAAPGSRRFAHGDSAGAHHESLDDQPGHPDRGGSGEWRFAPDERITQVLPQKPGSSIDRFSANAAGILRTELTGTLALRYCSRLRLRMRTVIGIFQSRNSFVRGSGQRFVLFLPARRTAMRIRRATTLQVLARSGKADARESRPVTSEKPDTRLWLHPACRHVPSCGPTCSGGGVPPAPLTPRLSRSESLLLGFRLGSVASSDHFRVNCRVWI